MKSYVISFLLTLLISSVAQAQDEEPENIIQNGDFEAQFQNWLFWTQDGALAERFIDSRKVEPIDGKTVAYVRIDKQGAGGTGNQVQFYQGPFPLKQGQKYTLSVWMMGGEGGEQVSILVLKHENPWTNYGSQFITLKEEWDEYSLTFTQPVDDQIGRIDFFLGTTEGDIWIDHVRLYEGEYFNDGIKELPKQTVQPESKLPTTWGNIKLR
jgi:hypothetical protein